VQLPYIGRLGFHDGVCRKIEQIEQRPSLLQSHAV
jgi:hypothetical protein